MSRLKDIQDSQNGTLDAPVQTQTREEILSHASSRSTTPSNPNGTGYVIFKLVNAPGKGSVRVDGIDDIINPNTKALERIRLITGVPSIWQKEQKDVDKTHYEKNRRSLEFYNGICRIPEWDTTALEFARHTRHCIGNPSHRSGSFTEFYEWNPAKQAEEQMRKKHFKIEAMKQALLMDEEKMKKHALYLGVNFSDEVGLPKTADAIRNDYVVKAEENPERFMETLNDKIVTISYIVKKSIRDAKIDIGRQPNTAYWAAGGLICHIPKSRQPADYLIELANTNSDEGRAFFEQLQKVTQ